MKWTVSDGTVVHLGGDVEGETLFAHTLRRTVQARRAGAKIIVSTLPPPGGEVLDLSDPWHISCLVREEAYARGLAITDEPEVEAPAEWAEAAATFDPNVLY